jgi:tetraacyldisaccharide 4'-kinase
MRAPGFWSRPSLISSLLSPVSALWAAAADARMARRRTPAPAAAICIGNFVAGGAGKTPVAALVCALLQQAGRKPAVLSRGYGGSLSGRRPVLVDPARHDAREVGDEALLLARSHVVVIGRDRSRSAALALQAGADVLVLDDGFQSAAFDCPALLVVDGAFGVGNGRVLPAGPLRASLTAQWRFASALFILGEGAAGRALASHAVEFGLPAFRGRLVPAPDAAADLRGRSVYAFAGIGAPEKFFRTLEDLGARVVGRRAFPDHAPYRDADLAKLTQAARRSGAERLVTTEKDMMRLRSLGQIRSGAVVIDALAVRAEPEQPAAFADWLSLMSTRKRCRPV